MRGVTPSTQAMASLRQLFDSLSREQRRNQDLLVSLAFAQRSFTNLNRFLELVPVVAARLVGVQGAILVPFQSDGRLWREQCRLFPRQTVKACCNAWRLLSRVRVQGSAPMMISCWRWIVWCSGCVRGLDCLPPP